MPELPDMTVFAENLNKAVAGKKITAVDHYAGRWNASPKEVSDALTGAEVSGIERSGKEACFRLSNGNRLLVHLMLTGGFVLGREKKPVESPIMSMQFEDGSYLVVNDPKGWVNVTLNPEMEEVLDALDVTADYLKKMFAKKPRMQAKAFLIDQKLIRGIGNAYADEILWEARISPKSAVGKLPPGAVDALAAAIPSVLDNAVRELRENHPGIVAGEIRDFLSVHNPSRQKSPTGHRIIREQVSSKTTYYTEEQKLYT